MKFRSGTVTNTSTTVSSTGINITSINIVNRHSAVVYVKFYDSDVATFQDTPIKTLAVSASGGTYSNIDNRFKFGTSDGLSIRVTTGSTDSDNTAAATLPIIELEY